jgi:hypothetical protein
MKHKKELVLTINDKDFKRLELIAKKLGIETTDVIIRGLQLMLLYYKTKKEQDNKSLFLIRNCKEEKEILV